jgi:hypothetical protein
MIFDIKMDLTRKARFVAGGHTTDTPASMTYSSVVSRDSVRIAFTYAALMGMDVWAADIGNAYLNAKCRERIWTVAGKEFGSDEGQVLIIVQALYGLKSSGAAWRSTLAESLSDMGFSQSRGDPDVHFSIANSSGKDHYEYILVYVDDLLVLSYSCEPIMDRIGKIYRLKDGSVGSPELYLGASITKTNNGERDMWSMSSDRYIEAAIKNVEVYLEEVGERLRGKVRAVTPFASGYKPELETSGLLGNVEATKYQELIGVLRWAVEIGRIDILTEVSLLSQHLAAPRQGHLGQVFHVFAYLKAHPKLCLCFDSRRLDIDNSSFKEVDWSDFYPDADSLVPDNCPKSLGETVKITCYVDANHAGNMVTRRSHTGFVIFMNSAPIIWWSKRQNTVETSTFGSEYVALRIATEQIIALRYKLSMMGIKVEDPANVFCDNEAVAKNSATPESVLSKKHNAICFHKVRECCAAGIIRVGWIDGKSNPADLFTKVLPAIKRNWIIKFICGGGVGGPNESSNAREEDPKEDGESRLG